MDKLRIWKGNQFEIVGEVFYDTLSQKEISTIYNEMMNTIEKLNKKLNKEISRFELEVNNNNIKIINPVKSDLNSKVLVKLCKWISKMDNHKLFKITYNWITEEKVETNIGDSYYILTLFGDDWVGTYLSIETDKMATTKFTKSKKLYPDERTDIQHYYDGGCLIKINGLNGKHKIEASNCVIFHFH